MVANRARTSLRMSGAGSGLLKERCRLLLVRAYGFSSSAKLSKSEPLKGRTLAWFLKAA